MNGGAAHLTRPNSPEGVGGLSVSTVPMEAQSARDLPGEGSWQYEPKWDGFRCLAFKEGEWVELRSKSGRSLSRFFPEVVHGLRELSLKRFVIDGELVINVDGTPAFGALQMRLHPAVSRITRLSIETPARLIAFDLLVKPEGRPILDQPLEARRMALEELIRRAGSSEIVRLSPRTTDLAEARKWVRTGLNGTDGVVAKRTDRPYEPGERRMVKVKRVRTADCVVGGFRYGSSSRLVGSLLLGLYDHAGVLDHVGYTSSIKSSDRSALTKRLEALRKPPGFTGKSPGGPSRWSTKRSSSWEPLEPVLVVEVEYDHVTARRFRHGAKLVRWRPDKAAHQCTFEQILPLT